MAPGQGAARARGRVRVAHPTGQTVTEWPQGRAAYRAVRKVGSGGFSRVWEMVRADDSGARVAVKISSLDKARRRDAEGGLLRECALLFRTRHPHILPCLTWWEEGGARIYEVLELAHCDLFSIMETHDRERTLLDEATVARFALGIARALHCCHATLEIVHRDVKIDNVLLMRDGAVRLADFALSVPDGAAGVYGTRGVEAPECRRAGRPATDGESDGDAEVEAEDNALGPAVLTYAADLWALGCVVVEALCCLSLRGHPAGPEDALARVAAARGQAPNPALRGFFAATLAPDRRERWSAARLLAEDAWLCEQVPEGADPRVALPPAAGPAARAPATVRIGTTQD